MLLSDELLALGRKANKKNNLSQAEQCTAMLHLLIKNTNETSFKQLRLITSHVVKKLNEEGFSYYKFDIFWYPKKIKA